jgi:hypothetical protein
MDVSTSHEADLADLATAWPTGDPIGDYNRAHMEALLDVATRGGPAAFDRVRLAESASPTRSRTPTPAGSALIPKAHAQPTAN